MTVTVTLLRAQSSFTDLLKISEFSPNEPHAAQPVEQKEKQVINPLIEITHKVIVITHNDIVITHNDIVITHNDIVFIYK
jgi:hypothetical protein